MMLTVFGEKVGWAVLLSSQLGAFAFGWILRGLIG